MQIEDPNADVIIQPFIDKLKHKQAKKLSLLGRTIFGSGGEQRLEIFYSLRDMLNHCTDYIEDYPGFEVSIEDFKEWTCIRNEFFEDLQVKCAFEQLTDFQVGSSEEPYAFTVKKSHNGLSLRFHNPLILERLIQEIEKQVFWREESKSNDLIKKEQEEKQNKSDEKKELHKKSRIDVPYKIICGTIGGIVVLALKHWFNW